MVEILSRLMAWYNGDREKAFFGEVEEGFAHLVERGFQVTERHYNPQSFGNGWVTYRRGRLTVRVVRDRGHFFADFFTDEISDRPIPYWLLKRRLGGPTPQGVEDHSLRWLAEEILSDLVAIEALLDADAVGQTVAEIDADYKAWVKQRFGIADSRNVTRGRAGT